MEKIFNSGSTLAGWRSWVGYVLLVVVAAAYFSYFQTVPTFADPDSFFHTKMSLLIAEHGVVDDFPWPQATILKENFIDQHLLYHVFLVPFVTLFDPLVGAKVANIVLSVALATFFYWLLRHYQVKLAIVFAFLLLASTPFIFRVSLIKAPVFSLLILLVGVYLLFDYKYFALWVLSWIYVWSYGGFVLILVVAGLFAFVSVVKDWGARWRRSSFSLVLRHNREVRLLLVSLAGVVAGLIANPYFPKNVIFYWHQLVKIGIINLQDKISVGNEWYPYKFFDLASGTALLTTVLLVALVVCALNFKRLQKKTWASLLIFVFFLLFTLKSRRYVEYYVPFAVLFAALAISGSLPSLSWRSVWEKVSRFRTWRWPSLALVVLYFGVTVPALITKDIRQTYRDFENGISTERFAASSAWLAANSEGGEVVFHSSWDEFPILFYYNTKNYYIAGLDPTFTYEYDESLYRKMVDITIGTQREGIHEDIKNSFNSSYVFVERNHTAMDSNIRGSEGFAEVYQDGEVKIYKVL